MLAAFSFFSWCYFLHRKPSQAAVILTKVCGEMGGQVGARSHVLIGNPRHSLPLEEMLKYHLCSHVLLLWCKSNLRFKAICN